MKNQLLAFIFLFSLIFTQNIIRINERDTVFADFVGLSQIDRQNEVLIEPIKEIIRAPVIQSIVEPVKTQTINKNDIISPGLSSFVSTSVGQDILFNAQFNTGQSQYAAASKFFSAQQQLKQVCCQGCNTIRYVAFRLYSTQFYLKALGNNVYISNLKGLNNEELFTAIQNIDCTWSFKNSANRYISLNFNNRELSLKDQVGLNERFYMQRKDKWIYIQSAEAYRYYWAVQSNNAVSYGLNQATRWVMEMWPQRKNGWN